MIYQTIFITLITNTILTSDCTSIRDDKSNEELSKVVQIHDPETRLQIDPLEEHSISDGSKSYKDQLKDLYEGDSLMAVEDDDGQEYYDGNYLDLIPAEDYQEKPREKRSLDRREYDSNSLDKEVIGKVNEVYNIVVESPHLENVRSNNSDYDDYLVVVSSNRTRAPVKAIIKNVTSSDSDITTTPIFTSVNPASGSGLVPYDLVKVGSSYLIKLAIFTDREPNVDELKSITRQVDQYFENLTSVISIKVSLVGVFVYRPGYGSNTRIIKNSYIRCSELWNDFTQFQAAKKETFNFQVGILLTNLQRPENAKGKLNTGKICSQDSGAVVQNQGIAKTAENIAVRLVLLLGVKPCIIPIIDNNGTTDQDVVNSGSGLNIKPEWTDFEPGDILSALRTDNGWCLLDTDSWLYPELTKNKGDPYDQKCADTFGPDSILDYAASSCENLYCTGGPLLRSLNLPALEYSPCIIAFIGNVLSPTATNTLCVNEKCIGTNSLPNDNSYTVWSKCQGYCPFPYRSRSPVCPLVPPLGNLPIDWPPCPTELDVEICPDKTDCQQSNDFIVENSGLCREFSPGPFFNEYVPEDPCRLYCLDDNNMIVTTSLNVTDGTWFTTNQGQPIVCIQGIAYPIHDY